MRQEEGNNGGRAKGEGKMLEEEEEGRKDKRQWEKRERGKSVAVVLVSSQVKDLINMGAQSQ